MSPQSSSGLRKVQTYTIILRFRNQYFLRWRSYPMGSWRMYGLFFCASATQSVTPDTLCATQISHCHSSSGTSSSGGLTHSRWYTAEQVSQHSNSPRRWHTRQWSSYCILPSDISSSRAMLVVRNWSTKNCSTLILLRSEPYG